MTLEYKGCKLSNSLSMFLYYKSATGSTMEKDISLIQQQRKIIDDENTTEEEKNKALDKVDATQVLTNVYYSMRCAAEGKKLDYDSTIAEVDISDLISNEFSMVLEELMSVKKKQSGFLKKHLRK